MKTPLEKIREWLSLRGYQLDLNEGLEWRADFVNKRITGDPHKLYEIPLKGRDKIVMLLHECGHVERQRLVLLTGTPWQHDLVPPPIKKGEKPPSSFYLAILQEEVAAWDAAFDLSKRLQLTGFDKAMARLRVSSLAGYIRWAAVEGDYENWYKK